MWKVVQLYQHDLKTHFHYSLTGSPKSDKKDKSKAKQGPVGSLCVCIYSTELTLQTLF